MVENRHVFISHARADGRAYAIWLKEVLERHGIRVWFDATDLSYDRPFSPEIEDAIRTASYVLACITHDVVERNNSFVRKEIQYALAVKTRVISLRFADLVMPIEIIGYNWVDFVNTSRDEALGELLKVLKHSTQVNQSSHPDQAINNHTELESPEQIKEKYTYQKRDVYHNYLQRVKTKIDEYLDKTVYSLPESDAPLPLITLNIVAKDSGLSAAFFTTAGISQPLPSYTTLGEELGYSNVQVLLLGEPGSGKTITLMVYARDAVAKRISDPEQPLPIIAPISTWDAINRPTLSEWLGTQVGIPKQEVEMLLSQNKALLLLDGLDELDEQREDSALQEKFDPRARFLELIAHQKQVVITCRRRDYENLEEEFSFQPTLMLEPLTDHQLEIYLGHFSALAEELWIDDALRSVLRTPLFLRLFSFAYKEVPDEASELNNLSKSVIQRRIFQRYIKRRFEHEERKLKKKPPFTLHEIQSILGKVAVNIMLRSIRSEQADNTEVYAGEVWFIAHIADAEEFATFCEDLGLFVAQITDLSAADATLHYFFSHHLFRDFFAYDALIASLRPVTYGKELAERLELLGRLRNEEAIPYVLPYLLDTAEIQHPRWGSIWGVAIDALEAIGESAIPYLITVLEKDDLPKGASKYIVRALGHIGNSTTVPFLIDLIRSHSDVSDVVKALKHIGKPAVEQILTGLEEPYPKLAPLVEALGEIGDERACEKLSHILDDRTNSVIVRREAARSLEQIDCPQAVKSLIEALDDSDGATSWWAMEALVKIGDKTITDVLIERGSAENDLEKRRGFVFTATRLGDYRAISLMAPILAKISSEDNFKHDLFESITDQRAIPPLLQIFQQAQNETLQRLVAEKLSDLCNSNSDHAVEDIIQLLLADTVDKEKRALSIRLLGLISDSRSVETILWVLRDDPEAYLRGIAAESLAESRDPRAVEGLELALLDKNIMTFKEGETTTVSDMAVFALECIDTPEAHRVLENWRRQQIR